ncbi:MULTISPECIES: polyprenyl diphosphate synthase [unclassified Streptomyces]|uniref:polyprenyl diphosphate synthase n=1 Tax=unclassified Streptomyces TaxID=2593676 RepID=UPI002259DE79|nr:MULTISPECIES: polyprenyl diphosphate synthase [unclassified Streptomyces]MCX5063796.1 polyprenyl diphosphate synthase [Streptomyces sp. NBC_00452]MCX5294146.1 polyprenyl diphosphate synthase [Streptomyces sp. NBC_00183]
MPRLGEGAPAGAGEDADVRAAYRACRKIVREAHSAEYALLHLMPPQIRPACWALYAAFHTADGLIDTTEGTPAQRAEHLAAWTAALRTEADHGRSGDPVRRALVDTVRRWEIDLDDLQESLSALAADADGTAPATWHDWHARVKSQNTGWVGQFLRLLERCGVRVPVDLGQLAAVSGFLDGLYLTDTLADLADDVHGGTLTLPAEVLGRFPGAGSDLPERQFSPDVQALVAHLLQRARQCLADGHAELRHHLHPGADILLQSIVALFRARLDMAEKSGPAILQRPCEPDRLTRWRIMAPARLKAFLLWRLVPLHTPSAVRPQAAVPPQRTPGSRQPSATVTVPAMPVPAHPSGAHPPTIDRDRLPHHVAIIMDGNGRWANSRGLPRTAGHTAGVRVLRDMAMGALEIGLDHLSLYTFSTENWNRSADEVFHIFRVLGGELEDGWILRHDIRLRWIGDAQRVPCDLAAKIRDQEAATRHRTGLTLNLCLDYGGRTELARAGSAIARAARTGDLTHGDLTERDFARYLPYPEMPDVDLLWRTGGEQRLSNLLPWHATYAELHFTSELWPQVDRRDLWQVISDHMHRRRRYGAAPSPDAPPAWAAARTDTENA